MIDIAVNRPVATAMFFVAVCLLGIMSFNKMPVELLPDLGIPRMTVITDYEEASAREVEKSLTRPLEEILSGVEGVREVRSSSTAGISTITMLFQWGKDMGAASLAVREKLDLARSELPEGSGDPRIVRVNSSELPVLSVAVYPPGPHLSRELRRRIVPAIERLQGVAVCRLEGMPEDEVVVYVDRDQLKSRGISLKAVGDAITGASFGFPAGKIEKSHYAYLVRTAGEIENPSDLEKIPVDSGNNGETVYLGDVAEIRVEPMERQQIVRFDGKSAALLSIIKEPSANAITVADAVKNELQGIEAELNEKTGASLSISYDDSVFIENSMNGLMTSAVTGGLLAFMTLWIFLGDILTAGVILLAIPVSIIATFNLLYFAGISLNMMSLGGLAIGVGMLVDNAIVVLESMTVAYGKNRKNRSRHGAKAVSSAVAAATFTTMVVFIPVAYMGGIAGRLFLDQAISIAFALGISLIMSLLLVPMLYSKLPESISSMFRFIRIKRRKSVKAEKECDESTTASVEEPLPAYAENAPFADYASFNDNDAFVDYAEREEKDAFGSLNLFDEDESVFKDGLEPENGSIFKGIKKSKINGFSKSFEKKRKSVEVSDTIYASDDIEDSDNNYETSNLEEAEIRYENEEKIYNHGRIFSFVASFYDNILNRIIRYPATVMAVSIVLTLMSVPLAAMLDFEFMPAGDEGQMVIELTGTMDSTVARMSEKTAEIEKILSQNDAVKSFSTTIGQSETGSNDTSVMEHKSRILVSLTDRNERVSASEVADQIRKASDSKLEMRIKLQNRAWSSAHDSPIRIDILGPELDVLRSINRRIKHNISAVEGVGDISGGDNRIIRNVDISLRRYQLAQSGVTVEEAAEEIRTAVAGRILSTMEREDETLDIRLRVDKSQLSNTEDIGSIPLRGSRTRTDNSAVLSLREVSEVQPSLESGEIDRIDGVRASSVSATVTGGRFMGGVLADIEDSIAGLRIPDGYSVETGGEAEEITSATPVLRMALILAITLVGMILAAQLESLTLPLVIMLSVPLALTGVIIALWISGTSISVVSALGTILLIGIAVNNAILLVDRAASSEKRGADPVEAVIEAGHSRLRPILMTTITTVLGLIPLMLPLSEGTELRAPMAVAVTGGLVFSTIMTLFVVPAGFVLLRKTQQYLSGIFSMQPQSASGEAVENPALS